MSADPTKSLDVAEVSPARPTTLSLAYERADGWDRSVASCRAFWRVARLSAAIMLAGLWGMAVLWWAIAALPKLEPAWIVMLSLANAISFCGGLAFAVALAGATPDGRPLRSGLVNGVLFALGWILIVGVSMVLPMAVLGAWGPPVGLTLLAAAATRVFGRDIRARYPHWLMDGALD